MTTEQSPRMRDLIQAGQNRRLTDAERLELAAMTWTGDEALELARLVKVRHPDEVHRLLLGTRTELDPDVRDSYEQRRARAIAGGRVVPELGPEWAARIDAAIAVLRETDAPASERSSSAARRPSSRTSTRSGARRSTRPWPAAVSTPRSRSTASGSPTLHGSMCSTPVGSMHASRSVCRATDRAIARGGRASSASSIAGARRKAALPLSVGRSSDPVMVPAVRRLVVAEVGNPSRARRRRLVELDVGDCATCGLRFEALRLEGGPRRFCSPACRARRPRHAPGGAFQRTCPTCGGTFETYIPTQQYDSIRCRPESLRSGPPR